MKKPKLNKDSVMRSFNEKQLSRQHNKLTSMVMEEPKKTYSTDKEIYAFLGENKKASAKLYGDILDQVNTFRAKASNVFVQESDDQLGIIVDAYEGEDNVDTATFWYDDYPV